jgi:uncharacterized protein YecA (UPF0149 family)
MQSFEMPARAFDLLPTPERRGIVHHEHLATGKVRVREVFTGTRAADIHAAMDEARRQAEALGATGFHRTAIGRNAPCPCGSTLKFKKCCIGKARTV